MTAAATSSSVWTTARVWMRQRGDETGPEGEGDEDREGDDDADERVERKKPDGRGDEGGGQLARLAEKRGADVANGVGLPDRPGHDRGIGGPARVAAGAQMAGDDAAYQPLPVRFDALADQRGHPPDSHRSQ